MCIKNERLKMNLQLFSEGEDLGFNEETIPSEDLGFDEETIDDNYQEEEQEEQEQEEEQEQPLIEEQPGETDEEKRIRIKYNKQDVELTIEEATILAQKGMNYDKQSERLEQLQNNPGLQYIQDLAAKSGVEVKDLVAHWKAQEEQAELDALIQQNIPEEYAREMLESRKFREEQQRMLAEQKIRSEKEEKNKADFIEFINDFGGIKPEEIPKEVWDKVDEGASLKQAYMEHDYKRLQQENQILKQNNSNKAKAPGTSSNSNLGGASDNYDAFLDGFDSI